MRRNGDIDRIKWWLVDGKMQKLISLKSKDFSCNGPDRSPHSVVIFSGIKTT
jgi:hypothetical protein